MIALNHIEKDKSREILKNLKIIFKISGTPEWAANGRFGRF
jgi:hypothetical protein